MGAVCTAKSKVTSNNKVTIANQQPMTMQYLMNQYSMNINNYVPYLSPCIPINNILNFDNNQVQEQLAYNEQSNVIEYPNAEEIQSSEESYQFWHSQIFDLILKNYTQDQVRQQIDEILMDGLILALNFGKFQQKWHDDQSIHNLDRIYDQMRNSTLQLPVKKLIIYQFLANSDIDFEEIIQAVLNMQHAKKQSFSLYDFGQLVSKRKLQNRYDIIESLNDIFIIGFECGRNIGCRKFSCKDAIDNLQASQQELIAFNFDQYQNPTQENRYLKNLLLDELIWTKESQLHSLLNRYCPICIDKIDYMNLVKIESCQHSFHKRCLADYVEQQLSYSSNQMKCPETCSEYVTMHELEIIFDEVQLQMVQEQMNKKLFQENYQVYQTCLTQNCNYTFIFEGEDNFQFLCPNCLNSYCLSCKTPYHLNMNCQQFRESPEYINAMALQKLQDHQFQEFVKQQNLRQCPNCKMWVERSEGCLHLTCICKYEFCYRCGGQYNHCACGG